VLVLAFLLIQSPADYLAGIPWMANIDSDRLTTILLIALVVLAIFIFVSRTRVR
jgi:hypothetical protein